jgi:hypothetical protein
MIIKGYFNKSDLKVYVDYYFRDNNLDVCRQLGYFDFRNNWQKVTTNTDLESVFNDVTLESLNIEDLNHFTPPTLTPYAVVIPEIYQWAFPQDKFILGGFEIPLDTHNQDKVVNIAYFMWQEFRAELDSGKYNDLKRALMPLWDYVELQVNNQNLVVL